MTPAPRKLTELEPQFLHWSPDTWPNRLGQKTVRHVPTLAEANGIFFVCPVCLAANGDRRPGVHGIECWNPGVPIDTGLPGPGRWSFEGTGYADLTLVAGSSSIHLTGPGCGAHFFIINGEIR